MNLSFQTVLRIGLEENTYPECDSELEKLFSCPDVVARSVGHWLKLVWNGPTELTVYPEAPDGGWNEDLFNDLRNSKIDVNPVENVILDEYISNFTILSTLSFDYYKFYTKIPSVAENGVAFLFYPFQTNLWIALSLVLLITFPFAHFVKHSTLCRSCPHYKQILHSFRLYDIFRAFICCIYSSHLWALLTIHNNDIPIKDMDDLIKKLYQGDAKIYLEGTNSWRWYLLTEESYAPHEKIKQLQTALNETNSLKIDRNIHTLCERVAKNSDAIFLAYDDLVVIECPQFCFWTHLITEIPIKPAAFLMSKQSKFKANGTVAAHSLVNFRENMMRMTSSVAPCKSGEFAGKGELINGKTLSAAFIFYAVAMFNGIIVFVVEFLVSKFQFRRFTTNLQLGLSVRKMWTNLNDNFHSNSTYCISED